MQFSTASDIFLAVTDRHVVRTWRTSCVLGTVSIEHRIGACTKISLLLDESACVRHTVSMVVEHHLHGGGLKATPQRQLRQDCFTGHTHSTSRHICCYARVTRKRRTRFTAGPTFGGVTICRFGNRLDQVHRWRVRVKVSCSTWLYGMLDVA